MCLLLRTTPVYETPQFASVVAFRRRAHGQVSTRQFAEGGSEGRADLGVATLCDPAVGRQTRGAQNLDRARARLQDRKCCLARSGTSASIPTNQRAFFSWSGNVLRYCSSLCRERIAGARSFNCLP